ncbi:bottleneck [Cochliomyia hominivorax]
MSLTAYNFQFYTYNMQTHRNDCNDSVMDVDDIDMSIPPPKPPRASALLNNSSPYPWMTSTPKSIFNEKSTPTTTAAAAAANTNYLTVPHETPKSIYSSGATIQQQQQQQQSTKSAELQLRPKLHVTQKRWSHELREKALKMSKRSSAGSDEENSQNVPHMAMHTDEQQQQQMLQLTPQHHTGHKSWSCEIREKALEMSKRNSGSFETSPAFTTQKQFGFNTTPYKANQNQENSLNFQTSSNFKLRKPLLNAEAYERMHQTTEETATTPTSAAFKPKFEAYYKAPPAMASEPKDPSQSVKDRICFFNKLTLTHSNSFIDLLKNSKTNNVATVQHSVSAQSTLLPTPLKPKRWSVQLEMNLQEDPINNLHLAPTLKNTTMNVTNNKTASTPATTISTISSPTSSPTPLSSSFTSKTNLYSSNITTQRKCSLRRRSSVDKTRRPIVRQNSNASSNGTKPQMHTVMEDLTLVMPVKLRVAEYERRIMMEC